MIAQHGDYMLPISWRAILKLKVKLLLPGLGEKKIGVLILGTRLGFSVVRNLSEEVSLNDIITSQPLTDMVLPNTDDFLRFTIEGKEIRIRLPEQYGRVVVTNFLSANAMFEIARAIDWALISEGQKPVFLPLPAVIEGYRALRYAGLASLARGEDVKELDYEHLVSLGILDQLYFDNMNSTIDGILLERVVNKEFEASDSEAQRRAFNAAGQIIDVMARALAFLALSINTGEFTQATAERRWNVREKKMAKGTNIFVMRARGSIELKIAEAARRYVNEGLTGYAPNPDIRIYPLIVPQDIDVGIMGPVYFAKTKQQAGSPIGNTDNYEASKNWNNPISVDKLREEGSSAVEMNRQLYLTVNDNRGQTLKLKTNLDGLFSSSVEEQENKAGAIQDLRSNAIIIRRNSSGVMTLTPMGANLAEGISRRSLSKLTIYLTLASIAASMIILSSWSRQRETFLAGIVIIVSVSSSSLKRFISRG